MYKRVTYALLVVVAALVAGQASAKGGGQTGSEAIVFERDGDLYAVAVDASRTVRLTKTRTLELAPAVSPDGRSIAYRLNRFGLWTMRVVGERRMRLTRRGDFDPAWSPDGGTIFFSRNTPLGTIPVDCPQIFRVGTDGRDLRRVTRVRGPGHIDPAVSPDGRRIVFTQEIGCESAYIVTLEVVDASGRPTSDLSLLPGNTGSERDPWHYGPTWSPDGGRIAFTRVLGPNNSGVFVADRDGSNLRRVTPRGINAWEPAWSPDGAWIAFVRDESYPNYNLYVIHPDGTGLRQLTRTKARESSPAWLPRMPAG